MGQVAARPRGVPGSSLASDAVTVHEEAGPTLLYTVPIVIVYGLLLCCFASQINSLLMLINWEKKKKSLFWLLVLQSHRLKMVF